MLWSLIRIRPILNRFRRPVMKVEMIQTLLNLFNISQRVSKRRIKHFWSDSEVITIKNSWNDSPRVRDFWRYNSSLFESIQKPRMKVLDANMVCKTLRTHMIEWDMIEGEKNTIRGGWIVLVFSSFSPKLKDTDQKQFKNNFWSDVQN